MRKKIIVNENQQNLLKLPKFIYKAIMGKYTSLGDNPALPSYGEFGFEYEMVKTKFIELNDTINEMIENGVIETNDPDYLISYLGRLITKCRKIEKPLRPQLEKLCENILNATLAIPVDTVLLKCKLVDKIQPKHDIRIMPEGGDNSVYSFEDVDEMELTNKVILKRRFINALIQGFSYKYSNMLDEWADTINGLNDELLGLWDKIRVLNDYLLYVKEEKISDDNNMQTSYVEVHLGKQWKKTMITSQGIIFPYLLKETFKGFFELFSSHGLPEDNEKAMYIIRKSDFLVAEPWDMRLGIPIVDRLDSVFKEYDNDIMVNTTMIPYFFTKLSELSIDVFNDVMKNLLAATNKGGRLLGQIYDDIVHDVEYQEFKDKISQKNIDTSLIMDDCFTSEELDDYVLSENSENEMMAYHGTTANFDKFNHKKYLNTGCKSQTFGWGTYITDDSGIATGYAKTLKSKNVDKKVLADHVENYLRHIGFSRYEAEKGVDFIIESLKWDSFDGIIHYLLNTEMEMTNTPMSVRRAYANALKTFNRPTSYIYEVDIPEDNGDNYVDWFEYFDRDKMIRLVNGIKSLRQNTLLGMCEYDEDFARFYDNYIAIPDDMYQENLNDLVADGFYSDFYGDTTRRKPIGSSIYDTLWSYTGSQKAASLLLMHCGFDGIKYKAGTRYGTGNAVTENPMNYVIFDANKVKIIKKTKQ